MPPDSFSNPGASLNVLVVGDDRRREFADVLRVFQEDDCLQRMAPGGSPTTPVPHVLRGLWRDWHFALPTPAIPETRSAATPTGPSMEEAASWQADVVVWLQAYPGQYPPPLVEAMRRWSPLAVWVVVLGTWCAGEGRSGEPLPGALRIPWHRWVHVARSELDALRHGRYSRWQLPATAHPSEYAAELPPQLRLRGQTSEGKTVGVVTYRFDAYEASAALVQAIGGHPVWLRPHEFPAHWPGDALFVLVDAEGDLSEDGRLLAQAAVVYPESPIVALLGYPRLEDITQAMRLGADCVLGKPFDCSELAQALVDLNLADRVGA